MKTNPDLSKEFPKIPSKFIKKTMYRNGDCVILVAERNKEVFLFSWDGYSTTYNFFVKFEKIDKISLNNFAQSATKKVLKELEKYD